MIAVAAGAAAAPAGAKTRPPLVNLEKLYGKPVQTNVARGHGLVFHCFIFVASDGYLDECFVVGRVKPKHKPKPGLGA